MNENEMIVGDFEDEPDDIRYFCPICGTVFEEKQLGDNLLFCPKCSVLNRLIPFSLEEAKNNIYDENRWTETEEIRGCKAERISPIKKKRVVIDDDNKQQKSLDMDSITYELYTKQHTKKGTVYGVLDLAEPDNNEDDVLEF